MSINIDVKLEDGITGNKIVKSTLYRCVFAAYRHLNFAHCDLQYRKLPLLF